MQSIMQYNGGCCIAMAGKDCFAIASDRRFGQQQMTVTCDHSKVCFAHFSLMKRMDMGSKQSRTIRSSKCKITFS
jgi:hypothetical protein